MSFRGGEFSTGTMGNFQPELTHFKIVNWARDRHEQGLRNC
jgi:hypothetical protein